VILDCWFYRWVHPWACFNVKQRGSVYFWITFWFIFETSIIV
jgi:hypothetical protein